MPELANVANVVIPQGVTVTFDTSNVTPPAQTGTVEVDSIGSEGSLTQNDGTLNIGTGGMTLDTFTQNGGTLTNDGSATLSSFNQTAGSFSSKGSFTAAEFSQIGGTTTLGDNFMITDGFAQGESGSITVAGNTAINDTSGGTVIGNINTAGSTTINSTSGAISQANGTTLIANGDSTLTASNGGNPADILLNSASNDFSTVNASGNNIELADANGIELGDITATGMLGVSASGNIEQAGNTLISVGGTANLTSVGGIVNVSEVGNNFTEGVIKTDLVDAAPVVLPPAPATSNLGSTGDIAMGSVQTNGVIVSMSQGLTAVGLNQVISVSVPRSIVTAGAGFSFELPASVRQSLGANVVSVTRANGTPLPDWLRFNSATFTFEASAVPTDGLPLEVRIVAGDRQILLVISERPED